MSSARNSASVWASSLSVLFVLSAITRSFSGWASTTRSGQRLDELDEPLVAGRRLDDHLERAELGEERRDLPPRPGRRNRLPLDDLARRPLVPRRTG